VQANRVQADSKGASELGASDRKQGGSEWCASDERGAGGVKASGVKACVQVGRVQVIEQYNQRV
jgi:hypothetical protein